MIRDMEAYKRYVEGPRKLDDYSPLTALADGIGKRSGVLAPYKSDRIVEASAAANMVKGVGSLDNAVDWSGRVRSAMAPKPSTQAPKPAAVPNAKASMQQPKTQPMAPPTGQGGFMGAFNKMAGPLGGSLANTPYTKKLAEYSQQMAAQKGNELQLNQTAQYFLSKGVKEEDVIYALQQAKAGNPKFLELIQKRIMEGKYEEGGSEVGNIDAKWKKDLDTRAREMAQITPMLEELESLEGAAVDFTKTKEHLPGMVFKPLQNLFSDKEAQDYRSKAAQWINVVLRDQSGAAVPEAEHKRYMAAYFPEMWESTEQIQKKAASRRQLLNSMTSSLKDSKSYLRFINNVRARHGIKRVEEDFYSGTSAAPTGPTETVETNTGVDGVVRTK